MKILVDGHCDTIQIAFDKMQSIDSKELKFNLKQVPKPAIQMMATFIHPKYENSFERAKNIIEYFYKQQKQFENELLVIKQKQDIEKVIKENKVGAVLTIENGRAIENNLNNVDYFYSHGVRLMSINWNEDNLLGCGALTKNDTGLTKFGVEYIKKLNIKNIIVDVSHSSQKTFWDAVKISEKTIVATHSCCKHLCNHPRNLSDEQIKQIAKMQGVVGICYCRNFLSETKNAGSLEIAKHIAYVANLVGVDYVSLGSDFDGLDEDEMPIDINGVKEVKKIEEQLKNIGFNENEISKIMGENWIRVLKEQLI